MVDMFLALGEEIGVSLKSAHQNAQGQDTSRQQRGGGSLSRNDQVLEALFLTRDFARPFEVEEAMNENALETDIQLTA